MFEALASTLFIILSSQSFFFLILGVVIGLVVGATEVFLLIFF